MDDIGAIYGLEVTFNEKRLVGRLMEKQKARETYEEAVKEGRQASILEENRPDVFTASIGNIKPGEVATVVIRYATQLEIDSATGTIKFILPTTIAPRYGNPSTKDDVNPATYVTRAPYSFSVRLNATMASVIANVTSPHHQKWLEASVHGNEATVTLKGSEEEIVGDRDIVVRFAVVDPWTMRGLVEHHPEAGTSGTVAPVSLTHTRPLLPSLLLAKLSPALYRNHNNIVSNTHGAQVSGAPHGRLSLCCCRVGSYPSALSRTQELFWTPWE